MSETSSPSAADLEIAAAGAVAAAETAARIEAQEEVEALEAERVAQAEAAALAIETERNEFIAAIGGLQGWLAEQLDGLRGALESLSLSLSEMIQAQSAGLTSLILALPQATAEVVEEMEETEEMEEQEEHLEETPPESETPNDHPAGHEPESEKHEPPQATKRRERPRY